MPTTTRSMTTIQRAVRPRGSKPSSYQHAVGNAFILWEGNIGIAMTADDIHGSESLHHGLPQLLERSGPMLGGSTAGKDQSTNATMLEAYEPLLQLRWERPGHARLPHALRVVPGLDHGRGRPHKGQPRGLQPRWSGNEGTYSLFNNDLLVRSTLYRWGNYDTVTGAVRWQPSEVPSGLTEVLPTSAPKSRHARLSIPVLEAGLVRGDRLAAYRPGSHRRRRRLALEGTCTESPRNCATRARQRRAGS